MHQVKMELNGSGHGAAIIAVETRTIGKMEFSISDEDLFVHHTEVMEEVAGNGVGGELLMAVTNYAREQSLKVIPLCSYVLHQFNEHPAEYTDVWKEIKNM